MTNTKRIISILQGIVILLFAVLLFLAPEEGLPVVVGLIGLGLSLRGAGSLLYYFRMARFMVGGKFVLCRGIILLDLGLFTAALVENPAIIMIIYIAVVYGLAGLIAILRAVEIKREGSGRWFYRAAYGGITAAVAVIAILCEMLHFNTNIIVYFFAAGLVVSAVRRIAGAFRRTAIVYIP